MKRILFVDDEPRVLRGLERSFYRMRDAWEMVFVEDGRSALELMAARSFDVVVTDMRMPGMNGSELLARVMELHPQTVRLVLSGHADGQLIHSCVGTAHQFLSKPCDPDALARVIDRATTMVETLHSGPLRRLLSRLQLLPSIPSLYLEVLEKAKDPEAPLDDIAKIIARDIGMSAKVLKLVNSAFFGIGRAVSDLPTAISYLGIDTIRSLVLGLPTFSRFGAVGIPGFSMDELWIHSLQTASAAKAISRAEGAGSDLQEASFAAGLLHDTGKLVLAYNLPEDFSAVLSLARRENIPFMDAERRIFQATHAEVGGYLLGLWGLPAPLVEAIALHHEPDVAPDAAFRPLVAVHAANVLVRCPTHADPDSLEPGLDRAFLERGGWLKRLPAWRSVVRDTLEPATSR